MYFNHDNSRKSGNGYDDVNVFGLCGIDLLHCCLIAYLKHTAAAQIAYKITRSTGILKSGPFL